MALPNWFELYAQDYFTAHLAAVAGIPGLSFLQVGVFTGDATCWLLEHVLTGDGAVLVDVDTWAGSEEHDGIDFTEVERLYDQRTVKARQAGRLIKWKGSSEGYLTATGRRFDFIYIDGDHSGYGVLNDAVGAYRVLKPGGLIAFDDYLWRSGKGPAHDPGPAIDAFVGFYGDRLTVVERDRQVWVRRAA